MIKGLIYWFIFQALLVNNLYALEAEKELDSLITQKNINRQQYYNALVDLKKRNAAYRIKLRHEDDYQPNLYEYTLSLWVALSYLPEDYSKMLDCPDYKALLLSSHRAKTIEELPYPMGKVFLVYSKLCSEKN